MGCGKKQSKAKHAIEQEERQSTKHYTIVLLQVTSFSSPLLQHIYKSAEKLFSAFKKETKNVYSA